MEPAHVQQLHGLYDITELRTIERAALASLPPFTLMQRAASSTARLALEIAGRNNARILAVAGPGNNGGDAIEAAKQLREAGRDAQILLLADPARLTGDAAQALQRACAVDVPLHTTGSAQALLSQSWDLVLDGIFGIGLARPIENAIRATVEALNRLTCPILAIDVPSGLDADTGAIVGGENAIAVRATHTITFIADKPGLHTGVARDHVGELTIDRIGIDDPLFPPPRASLITRTSFDHCLQPRRHASHKGSYGDVILLGGAHGMTGAPVLGARAALHCGAGRVHIAFVAPGLAADSGQPELMCRDAQAMDFARGVIVAGPGMGDGDAAVTQLARALASRRPLVLDADALNLIAVETGLRARLQARQVATLLTPHPLEAARLLDCTAASVQADRPAAARRLAAELNAIIVLKGSGTVVADVDGRIAINPTGNPALATAGTGDVLAGICGALLAQDWPLWEAAMAAVWLHGAAADQLVEQGVGPIGLTASELIPAVRSRLNRLIGRDFAPGRTDARQ